MAKHVFNFFRKCAGMIKEKVYICIRFCRPPEWIGTNAKSSRYLRRETELITRVGYPAKLM
jgi:hypothetical protein